MENATVSGWTDHTEFLGYKMSRVMWKVLPPFIVVMGTFGNLFTILVMRRIKDSNSSQYVILTVLAMADLCVLHSGLLATWVWYVFHVNLQDIHTVLCKLLGWALYASNTMSAWLVTTVTLQRTMAVMWPHRMRMMCTVRRTWVVVAVVVITACSMHLHIMVEYHLIEIVGCGTSGKYEQFSSVIWKWVDMCVSSIVPSTCLLVCSVILSWTLFKSASVSSTAFSDTSNVNTGQSHDSRKSNAVKVTVMILALSCTFLLLTVPVCIYLLLAEYADDTPKMKALMSFFAALTFLMWYSNSAVNFFLYCITGTRFRKEFLSLLLCCAKGSTAEDTTACTSSGEGSKR